MYNIPSKTKFTGKNLIYLPSCHSTNDFLAENVGNPLFTGGTVVVTNHQTKGKGQRGNSWESEPGANITASFLFKPRQLSLERQFFLNIISSLAVCEVVSNFVDSEELRVKWPNDVYVGQKKIAGILVQNFLTGKIISSTIVGIGLNVNQREFNEGKAVSLLQLTGSELGLSEVLEKLCEKLEENFVLLEAKGFDELKEEYLKKLYLFGRKSLYKDEEGVFEGKILGVLDSGLLVVEKNNKEKEYDFKKIQFL